MENSNPSKLQRLETILDLNYLIKKSIRLWWVFLIIGLVFGAAGYLFAKFNTARYKSHLTFALDDGSSGSSNIISLASELGFSLNQNSDVFNGDNILNILKSRRIIESVLLTPETFSGTRSTYIEKYLNDQKFFANGSNKGLHFPTSTAREKLTYSQDSLLKKVYLDMSASLINVERPDKRMSIYLLEVTSPSEEFTKKFTDELIAQSNKFYSELRTKKSRQTLDILEQRAAEIKGNLNASIAGKANVQDVNLNPAFSKAQVPVTKQQTNIQVYGGAYAEIFKNLEMARFQYLNSMPLMQIIDESGYPMEKIKRGKLLTAIAFAAVGCLIFFIILWLKRIFYISARKS